MFSHFHGSRTVKAKVSMDEEELLTCVRKVLAGGRSTREIKMFGGVGFMRNGNLLIAASRRGLLVRVGKDAETEALRRPGASPMVMRGRVMRGYLRVAAAALDPRAVASWVRLARRYVEALPKKPAKN
jgi:TfoX/Sxy family transcriptional regulator of competence genes